MSKIRVLLADDHAILREGVRALLALCEDIEVVGEAVDGQGAIEATRKLDPDVVVMDIAMPGLGGLEATLEIKKAGLRAKILILSQYEDREYVRRLLKAFVDAQWLADFDLRLVAYRAQAAGGATKPEGSNHA